MHKTRKKTALLKFILPSLIGVFLFMTPISQDGSITIPVAIFSKGLQNLLAPIMTSVLFGLVLFSAVGTLITKLFKPKFITNNDFLYGLFNPSWLWAIIRILAFIFVSIILIMQNLDTVFYIHPGK